VFYHLEENDNMFPMKRFLFLLEFDLCYEHFCSLIRSTDWKPLKERGLEQNKLGYRRMGWTQADHQVTDLQVIEIIFNILIAIKIDKNISVVKLMAGTVYSKSQVFLEDLQFPWLALNFLSRQR
jgi:hypothetical protein